MKRHHRRHRGQAHDLGRRKRLAAAEAQASTSGRIRNPERLAEALVRRGLASPLILDRWRRAARPERGAGAR